MFSNNDVPPAMRSSLTWPTFQKISMKVVNSKNQPFAIWQQAVENPWCAIRSSFTADYKQYAKSCTYCGKDQRRRSTESYQKAKIFLIVFTSGGTVWLSAWRSRPSPSSSTARSRSPNPSSGVSGLPFTPMASPCSAPGSWMRRFSRWGMLSFVTSVRLRLQMWACSCPTVERASDSFRLTFAVSVLLLLCWLSKNVEIMCECVNCPSYPGKALYVELIF